MWGLRESPGWSEWCSPGLMQIQFWCLLVPAYEGRVQHRENGGPHLETIQFSFCLYVCGTFPAPFPSVELKVNAREQVSLCVGSSPWSFWFRMESLPIFIASCCGYYTFQYWITGLSSRIWGWVPSLFSGDMCS